MNMERKTWRRSIDGYDDVGLRDGVSVGDAICDLAAYEDTGLEPKEIIALAKGTLKSATVDVGTKLYDLAVSNAFEKRYGIMLGRMCELAEADSKGLVRILPYSVLAYKIYTKRNRHGNIHKRIVECINYGFPESEIGKTIFLTREAAEAALKAGDTP